MKIIAMEKDVPGVVAQEFIPLLADEARRAWQLHQQGVIRELYFRADRDEAVLVLECGDLDEARAALATLPLVAAGLIEFELVPLVAYDGFARLFAEGR